MLPVRKMLIDTLPSKNDEKKTLNLQINLESRTTTALMLYSKKFLLAGTTPCTPLGFQLRTAAIAGEESQKWPLLWTFSMIQTIKKLR